MARKRKEDNPEPITAVEVFDAKPHPKEGVTPANAYDQETVENALELMLTHPVTEVAKLTRVSRRTLHEWKSRYGQWVQQAKDAEMVDEIDRTISDVLDKIDAKKLDKANARDLGIVLGILVDKKVALGGKPKDNPQIRARVLWRNPDGSEAAVEVN